jgi:hypothetical protein
MRSIRCTSSQLQSEVEESARVASPYQAHLADTTRAVNLAAHEHEALCDPLHILGVELVSSKGSRDIIICTQLLAYIDFSWQQGADTSRRRGRITTDCVRFVGEPVTKSNVVLFHSRREVSDAQTPTKRRLKAS